MSRDRVHVQKYSCGKLDIPVADVDRLARNMVDGLGVEGVDGTLRACAKAALSVLRVAQHVVVNIVEVCNCLARENSSPQFGRLKLARVLPCTSTLDAASTEQMKAG